MGLILSPVYHLTPDAPPPIEEEVEMAPRFAGDALNRPEFLALRDTISFAEGTWDADNNRPGYSYRYGDEPGSGGSLDITKPHPLDARPSPWGGSRGSNASGAYQYLDSTWSEMNGGNNAVMSPRNQDLTLHRTLTDRIGYDYDRPFNEQIHSLAPTWASFPTASGNSYHGQPVKDASVLNERYQSRLDFHRNQAAPNPQPAAPKPAAPMPKPPVPGPAVPASSRGAGRAAFQ